MNYAEVAVNSPGAQRQTFCYAVPPNIMVGHAVWLPFGRSLTHGIILQLTEYPSVEKTKEIIGLIDPRPILSTVQVELARWISEHYLSPLFDAAALMMPPGFERRVLTFLTLMPNPSEAIIPSLTPRQKALVNLIFRKGKVELAEVERALGKKEAGTIIGQLVRKKVVARTQELERVRVRSKVVPYIHLAIGADEAQREAECLLVMRRAPKQAELLGLLESGPVPLAEAKRHLGCTSAVVEALRRKGMVTIEQVQVYRDPLAHRNFSPLPAPALTAAQEAVWREIEAALESDFSPLPAATFTSAQERVLREIEVARESEKRPPIFLLHGVTGSGKTEIYLRALGQVISLGKRAIVLVPEIALTPQTIARFASRFPGRVAVLHSKLSVGEQFDEWWRIREGAFDVVIGSRGAIFAPQPDLGLIVIDEEHEWTYKQQEQSPRYHARDVAIRLAELTGSVLILGSATPDVTTYYKSQIGDFRLLELPERIAKGEKMVEVVDLREELKRGNRGIFSRSLYKGMEKALAAGEQVILFLNRRGSATFVQCRHCGYVLRCKRCDVSLTYHSAGEDLVCHQCNHRMAAPNVCPQCGSRRIKFLGIGTQKVEEEVGRAFPSANLLRWDRDVTRGKHSHEEILDKFLSHEADVLIGTQMIAKGLELPLVTLVGVINADVSLYLPDFRAGERTFQILTQVAGRAGRGILAGHVILQSYSPHHYAIVAAAKHDYTSFYEQEISLRRHYENPPFSRLVRLLYTNPNNAFCQREAQRMHRLLKDERDSWGMDVSLIGPSPAFIQRVRGRYRWQIILRGAAPVRLLAEIPTPQGWSVDIDPVSLL
ncbi:MAG: primosomal protein N' [Dehalococcoidia bacterium]|nr:primosomal protein N' [Dehalococcoidia bacterium]